jgi:hypothetical protein
VREPSINAVSALLLVAVLSFPATAGAQGHGSSKVSFAKAITFGTAVQYPNSIAAGDLNGDGFADLAVVTPDGGGADPFLTYALGNGNGTFGAWQYGSGTYAPGFVLLADVNRSGKLDALTTDALGSDVEIDFGDGNGNFPTEEDVTEPSGFLAVSDLNGDGIPDIVGTINGYVTVVLGEGKKKFSRPNYFPSGGVGTFSIAVGDLNHDGIPDLVVVNNDNVAVLLGKGNGKFRKPVTYYAGTGPSIVVLGDFNRDGNLDAATCNTSEIHVLLGKGDGTFSHARRYAGGGGWIATADFNGDGKLDLAVLASNNHESYASILLGNGDGTFQKARRFHVDSYPVQLVVADFNHDGRPDIATLSGGNSTISVLLNTTKFSVHPKRQH